MDGDLPDGLEQSTIQEVCAAGQLHRIGPAVWRRVRSAPSAPHDWLRVLDRARHHQLLRQMQASHDLRIISDSFAANGVEWVVSKGPVLADCAWPHADMRQYGDLDVIVRPADFGIALEALEGEGFTLLDRNWPELLRTGRAELALRGPSGLPLDLHWSISITPGTRRAFPFDVQEMLSRSRRVTLGTGVSIPAFDPTDLLLHVGFHAAQSGANRLVWIADVLHTALDKNVDWEALHDRARRASASTPIALVLARTERTFNVELPLPSELRVRAQRSFAGRLAAHLDATRPFPGLPGDASLSGINYASARDNIANMMTSAAWQWIDVRRIEARVRRNGPDASSLDDDVPDPRARNAYLTNAAKSLLSATPKATTSRHSESKEESRL
nr:nucleotidyltransferase family protein [Microbacterium humi]